MQVNDLNSLGFPSILEHACFENSCGHRVNKQALVIEKIMRPECAQPCFTCNAPLDRMIKADLWVYKKLSKNIDFLVFAACHLFDAESRDPFFFQFNLKYIYGLRCGVILARKSISILNKFIDAPVVVKNIVKIASVFLLNAGLFFFSNKSSFKSSLVCINLGVVVHCLAQPLDTMLVAVAPLIFFPEVDDSLTAIALWISLATILKIMQLLEERLFFPIDFAKTAFTACTTRCRSLAGRCITT